MNADSLFRHRVFACALAIVLPMTLSQAVPAAQLPYAPEFTHTSATEWLNSPPLKLSALHGKPVLIEFWTFDCINCLNSIAWMKSIAQRTARRDLAIVSVHTPELAHEKQPANIRAAVQRLGITYPVMLDIDYSYWSAMNNRYWPAFYLIDAQGRVVASHFGELHVDDGSASLFERQIDRAVEAAVQ